MKFGILVDMRNNGSVERACSISGISCWAIRLCDYISHEMCEATEEEMEELEELKWKTSFSEEEKKAAWALIQRVYDTDIFFPTSPTKVEEEIRFINSLTPCH